MMQSGIDPWALVVVLGVLVVLLAILFWDASTDAHKYRAEARMLQEFSEIDGWVEEARFWRRHFDKEAAEAVTRNIQPSEKGQDT